MRVLRNTTHAALHRAGAVDVVSIGPGEFEVSPDIDLSLLPGMELEDNKARKLAQLEASRKLIEATPITGNQSGTLFSISRPEKVNEFLMGGVSIALDSSPSASFSMLDDNGVSVSYDKVLMGQIISFMNTAKQPARARYAARKAAIEAARNKTELDAVDTDLTKP